eukprot:TRINITY_DN9243_c0_g1_i14.p1 TRINITY_DN9243_c0_g1~~TRINITY_DN9243_c0_g1_i14.p1  ORF type:complete len:577 (-),score=142.98 TRINITY_DN9243_c0_g1_i14:246-1976(-)
MSRPSRESRKAGKKSAIGHYILEKTIGEGTFGKVKLATHKLTGEKVAIKVLEKDRITDVGDVERVAREMHILTIVRHPNLVQLYEIVETAKQLCLVTELAAGGEVYDHIVANKRLKEEEACKIFQQMMAGVEYLHKLKVVHRDLKPENLLFGSGGNVKLVDFGLSNTYKQGEKLKTACGSPCYAAPEMVGGKKYNGLEVDIWSAGVVLFTLLCGHLPFEDPNTVALYRKITSGEYTVPSFVSVQAKGMIEGILNVDPEKRFTIEDIKKHPWFSLVPPMVSHGLIVGVHQVPIEPAVLSQLDSYGFEAEYARKCIEANKHNAATTTYYLLLQKFVREGNTTPADISSPTFEPVTIGKRLYNLRRIAKEHASSRVSPTRKEMVPHVPEVKRIETSHKYSREHRLIEELKLAETGGSFDKESLNNTVVISQNRFFRAGKFSSKVKKSPNKFELDMKEVLDTQLKKCFNSYFSASRQSQKRIRLNTTEPLKFSKTKIRASSKGRNRLVKNRIQPSITTNQKYISFLGNVTIGTNASTTPSTKNWQAKFFAFTPKGLWNNTAINRTYRPKPDVLKQIRTPM